MLCHECLRLYSNSVMNVRNYIQVLPWMSVTTYMLFHGCWDCIQTIQWMFRIICICKEIDTKPVDIHKITMTGMDVAD